VTESVSTYREWLEGADLRDDLLQTCNRAMEAMNVVRAVRGSSEEE